MNYQKHYDLLIARARNRVLGGYVERHHVKPSCLGGGDEVGNLVALTAEEHFVAHQLLVKMYPGNSKLAFAAHMMTLNLNNAGNRSKNKRYSWLRKLHSRAVSVTRKGYGMSTANLIAIIKANTGRKKTTEEVEKIKRAMRGKPPSKQCQVASVGSSKMKGKKHSEETIGKMKLSQQMRRNREKETWTN